MRVTAHTTIALYVDGGEKPHATEITGGRGCNLWLGNVCVVADSAEAFEQLAQAALEAAEIQRRVDKSVCSCGHKRPDHNDVRIVDGSLRSLVGCRTCPCSNWARVTEAVAS